MLHLAAKDESGNITYGSVDPYRLDNTPPQVTTDTPNTILATLMTPEQEGLYNFTGYAISDNLTKQFVPANATDIIRGPEDAIKNLPDTLTDEQRQAAIDELTCIADAAIAALDGTSDPDEAESIAEQAREDMEKLLDKALASADGTAKPFVVLSALFALAAVLLAVFALLKRRDTRRKLFSAIFATFAVAAFLLTSGWRGFTLANVWTVVAAAFAICAAMGAAGGAPDRAEREAKG